MLSDSQRRALQAHREMDLLARTNPLPFVSGWETSHDIQYEYLAALQGNALHVDQPLEYNFIADDELLTGKVRQFHRQVDGTFPDGCDVFIGAGSSPLLTSTLIFLAERGEQEILYVPPTYHAYYQMAKILGLRLTAVGEGLTQDGESRIIGTLPDRRTTLLITDPSWISGRSFSPEFHRALADWQCLTGSLVVVDGTFQYTNWVAMAAEHSARLVPAQTIRLVCPTKSLCVHGVRCAYLVLPADLMEDVGWLYCKLVAATSIFDIRAAHLMLDQLSSATGNRDLVAEVRRRYAAAVRLGLIGDVVTEPSCTYYAFGRAGFDMSTVLAMNGRYFELPYPEDYIRINLLSPHVLHMLRSADVEKFSTTYAGNGQ